MPTLVLYCADPLQPRQPDDAFAAEAEAAAQLGLSHALFDFEALTLENDAAAAVRRVPVQSEPVTAIYRGWMLKPAQYSRLFDALAAKGVRLINDAAAYRHSHYLPESYSVIEGHTPRSVWMNVSGEPSIDQVMELLRPFGSAPVILKDFVKSRKHEWDQACFIPSASDRGAVERVVKRFIELQDDDLNEGLVFREFVRFEPLTVHSKSSMPLSVEFRIFYLDGRPVFRTRYWEEGEYRGSAPPANIFDEVAARVSSRFFTMDVALRDSGDWMIVELGDGQVAGLPDAADDDEFYRAIAANW